MQILPVSFNFNFMQPRVREVNPSVQTMPIGQNLKPLAADTVSFTGGSAPNAEPLRALLPYGIPDLYSDTILMDPNELQKMLDRRLFSGNLRTIVKNTKKYKHCLFPVEREFFNLLKAEAKRNPKGRLDEYIQRLIPQHSQKLLAIQTPIFQELNRLSTQMPSDLLEEYNYLMYVTSRKLSKEPVYVPFSVKEFKYKLGRINERIVKSKNKDQKFAMQKVMRMANSVPEISKEKRLSAKFPIKKYERNQMMMVLDIADFVERSPLKDDKDLQSLISISKSQVYKTPTNIKFNRKSFIHELKKITDRIPDKKLARKMEQVAVSLPTSKENISAFIMKSADRSAQQVGFDMFQGSLGSVDHLLASHKGGKNNIENYALCSSFMNSKKAHQRLAVMLRNNPEVRIYCQRHIDRLIELANDGTFDEVGLSINYIYSLARRIEKLSPKEDPLILDVSALQY